MSPKKKRVAADDNTLLGKHVVVLSACPYFKPIVEEQLTRLKQIPCNLHDPDMYRAIPVGMIPRKFISVKTQGYVLVRKLCVNDDMALVDQGIARAHKNGELILSLWEGYHRQLFRR